MCSDLVYSHRHATSGSNSGMITPGRSSDMFIILSSHYRSRHYFATSRELKHLDAVTVSRSPVFAWFSESLAGLSTTRAYNQQSIFLAKNARCIDEYDRLAGSRWLSPRCGNCV